MGLERYCYTSFPDGKLEAAAEKLKWVKSVFTAAGSLQFCVTQNCIKDTLRCPSEKSAGYNRFHKFREFET